MSDENDIVIVENIDRIVTVSLNFAVVDNSVLVLIVLVAQDLVVCNGETSLLS